MITRNPVRNIVTYKGVIRRLMDRHGLKNGRQLAAFLEGRQDTVYGWLNGQTVPNDSSIKNICRRFNISEDEYYLGEFTSGMRKIVESYEMLSPDGQRLLLQVSEVFVDVLGRGKE